MVNSIHPAVIYKQQQCTVQPVLYNDATPGLVLEDASDGSRVAVATINLPDWREDMLAHFDHMQEIDFLQGDKLFCFIKDYSENEGMLKTLIDAKLIRHLGLHVDSGYVTDIPVCEIIDPNLNQSFDELYGELDSETTPLIEEEKPDLMYLFFKS